MSAYEALAERIKNVGTCIERAKYRHFIHSNVRITKPALVRHLNVKPHRVSS